MSTAAVASSRTRIFVLRSSVRARQISCFWPTLTDNDHLLCLMYYHYRKKLHSLKTVCKDDSSYITQLKQQKSKRWHYLAAQRHIVNVLTSNITFLIFAVLVVWCGHCRPYKPF